MSHRKLLMQRMNDMIEAGHYRAKGTPRPAKAATDKQENTPAPAPKTEPEKHPKPEEKRGTPDPQSFVQGLARKRVDAVGESVHKALDERFKAKR
jgi:hypothetical protein